MNQDRQIIVERRHVIEASPHPIQVHRTVVTVTAKT